MAEESKSIKCAQCGKIRPASRPKRKRFCDDECRMKWWGETRRKIGELVRQSER